MLWPQSYCTVLYLLTFFSSPLETQSWSFISFSLFLYSTGIDQSCMHTVISLLPGGDVHHEPAAHEEGEGERVLHFVAWHQPQLVPPQHVGCHGFHLHKQMKSQVTNASHKRGLRDDVSVMSQG